MLTAKDFYDRSVNGLVSQFPTLDLRLLASDPQLIRNIWAVAHQLAMYSSDSEVALAEPFVKSRPATILADAAMRGIVPKSTPMRARIALENGSAVAVTIDYGRLLTDVQGRPWTVVTAVTAQAGETAYFEAEQREITEISHKVTESRPLYAIAVPPADDGSVLCALSVSDADGEYQWRDRYIGAWPGDRVFHVESDERGTVYVRFGIAGQAGTQPAPDSTITLGVARSFGNVVMDAGSPFSLEGIASMAEAQIKLTADSTVTPGQDPISVDVLADLARYPAIYTKSDAVFLANFDFMLRQSFYDSAAFLSVWNEAGEERWRGPNIENINCLFVACTGKTGAEQVLTQQSGATVLPTEITTLTPLQEAIKAAILRADDSYRVRFFTPVRAPLGLHVWCKISTSYVRSDVEARIREVVLTNFGEQAAASRRGRGKPLHVQVYDVLRENVPALQGGGRTDLTVNIPAYNDADRPELWRFVHADLLTVDVQVANILTPGWA